MQSARRISRRDRRGDAENSVDDKYSFQVRAMKIGFVSACVVLDARRERRDGAENAETNDFHETQRQI
jgi:hypothetical protein